ncbi:MAG: zf-HC2 domain-containing protein [Chloroflexota bacterium]|nr:zf-HC2 domain-containing protein [Chloroflexota bacterium]
MKHQPFETWLLLDDPLEPEQIQALDDHLRTCQHCRQLRDAWAGAAALLHDAPAPEPAPGFTQRWQERLKKDRRKEIATRYRWQSWIILILIANVVSVLAIVLGLEFFATYDSLIEVLLFWVYRLTSLLTLVNILQDIITTLLNVLPELLPAGGWAALAGLLGGITLLWAAFIAKIAQIPRRLGT